MRISDGTSLGCSSKAWLKVGLAVNKAHGMCSGSDRCLKASHWGMKYPQNHIALIKVMLIASFSVKMVTVWVNQSLSLRALTQHRLKSFGLVPPLMLRFPSLLDKTQKGD